MNRRNRRRYRRWVLAPFGWALPLVNWASFIVGLVGFIGTAAGLLPPFNGSLWGKVTTSVVWILLAREGYDGLADEDEDPTRE